MQRGKSDRNLRHAVALSLMGSLLVLPPPGPGGQGNDTSAPPGFSFKTVYSSREECEKVKSQLINLHPPNPKDPIEEQRKLEGEKAGLCVPNDDQSPSRN
jgi:hypothetical protein